MLLEEPFCRICLEGGKHVRAAVVDHIVPLEWSRCDERWNKQALCGPCHDAKSLAERLEGRPGDVARRIAKLKAEWLSSAG